VNAVLDRFQERVRGSAGARYGGGEFRVRSSGPFCCETNQARGVRGCAKERQRG
jgi:hypothetical protein